MHLWKDLLIKKAASVCKNWTQMRWKIKEVRYYFDYLNCLSSIRPEGVGTLVLVSVVPSTQPHSFIFLSYPHFMLAGERAGGERKIIMCRGTPAQFFFQCVNLVKDKEALFNVAYNVTDNISS